MEKTLIMLPLIVLMVSFPIQSSNDSPNKVFVRKNQIPLQVRNFIWLDNFCEGDTLKMKEYWHAIYGNTRIFLFERDEEGEMLPHVELGSCRLKGKIFVNIKQQKLSYVEFIDTFRIAYETKISSGRWEKSTPRGDFKITKKRLLRNSKKYGGTMVNWLCISPDESVGIHALRNRSYERNLGKPVSHGCIRVSTIASQALYKIVPISTPVIIE